MMPLHDEVDCDTDSVPLELNAVDLERLNGLQWNAAIPRDFDWLILKLLIVVVTINGHPCRVLLDSGSLSDFIFSSIRFEAVYPGETTSVATGRAGFLFKG